MSRLLLGARRVWADVAGPPPMIKEMIQASPSQASLKGVAHGSRKMLVENPALWWSWVLGTIGLALPFGSYVMAKEDDPWFTMEDVHNNDMWARLRAGDALIKQNAEVRLCVASLARLFTQVVVCVIAISISHCFSGCLSVRLFLLAEGCSEQISIMSGSSPPCGELPRGPLLLSVATNKSATSNSTVACVYVVNRHACAALLR